MSDQTTPLGFEVIDMNVLFGPKYLNLPGLTPHIYIVIISAIFYEITFTVIAPLLWNLFDDPAKKKSDAIRPFWYSNIVSITQSTVNTMLAIYVLWHPEFREGLTAQERILGYHKETAQVLAVATGYFVFHLYKDWNDRKHHGMFMVCHAVCALVAVSLGFRPLGMHYTAIFLIWELPNLFLNFQRQLDGAGKRNTWYRAINRIILLSTYTIFRLGLGTVTLINMTYDHIVTWRDPHLTIRAQHVVPSLLSVGENEVQEVAGLPVLLSIFQISSMLFLHMQGFYWFSKIMFKGDLRAKSDK